MRSRRPVRWMVLATALLLGACESLGLDRLRPTEDEILARGWVKPGPEPAPAPQAAAHCYRTLAEVQCEPLPPRPPAPHER